MSESPAPFIIVEVPAALPELSYWKCAATLEPALPTWVGPAWGQVLSTPIDPETMRLSVVLTRDLYVQMIEDDYPSTAPLTLHHQLTQQALEILRRHGLQPVPVAKAAECDDEIPF